MSPCVERSKVGDELPKTSFAAHLVQDDGVAACAQEVTAGRSGCAGCSFDRDVGAFCDGFVAQRLDFLSPGNTTCQDAEFFVCAGQE